MKYWAFISYSHMDRKWGDWLHKALETYRVPRRLVGKESRAGKIPDRVFPIFRDREELPVSADLGSNINQALSESRYLIVICSPRSAKSRWVAEEIKTFKRLGRQDRILALIVAGEPNVGDKPGFSSEDECFPEPMRYRLTEAGELSGERTEPIAGDAREGKDGKNNAKLKLLAGLLGVNFDELRQREHERRLRRARAIGAGAFFLVGIFAALATWATIAAKQAASQKRQTQRLLVASDFSRAEEFFGKNDVPSALAFLARAAEQEPDKYSVAADRIWFALTERSWPLPISRPMRHNDAILSASFSPDGKRVVTASRDSTARIWDSSSGTALAAPLQHPRLVRRALFTPDGRYILTICFDGIGRLWNATSGEAIPNWRIKHPNSINSAAISPAGKWLATGSSDGTVFVSELATANRITEIHQTENVHTLIFHPTDETLLLSVSGSVANLWKVPEGRAIFELRHDAQINSAQFSSKGDRIVTGSSDGTVRVWDSATGKPIGDAMKHDGEITNAVLSSDDQFMASAIGNRVLLWEMGDKPQLKYTFDHGQRVACLRFSRDNLVIFSGTDGGKVQGRNVLNGETVGEAIWEDGAIASVDLERDGKRLLVATANGTARVWQPPPRYPISDCFTHAGAIESMELSPDGRLLLTGSANGQARLWDFSEDKTSVRQLPHGSAILSTTFSADGKFILTGGADAKVRVWLTSSGQPVGRPLVHASTVFKVVCSPEGDFFATGTEDGVAQFWDLSAQRPIGKPMVHGARLSSIGFNHDGKQFLTAGADGKVRLWHSRTGESAGVELRSEKEITCASFSPTADLVAAGSRDGIVNLWSAFSGSPAHRFTQKAAITDLAFSPDGQYLASGAEDGLAAIWDLSSAKSVGDLLHHSSVVSKVVFSPDSSKIATASEDGVVRLWHVSTGRTITEPLHHQKAVRCLVFSRDGRVLFSGSRDRTVRAWDIATGLAVSDRTWLASFARAISPATLNEAGRIEQHSIETRENVRAEMRPQSVSAHALSDWFFAEPAQRPLTPYARQHLATYLSERVSEKSEISLREARFFSMREDSFRALLEKAPPSESHP
jgi:WD40 repeat protein